MYSLLVQPTFKLQNSAPSVCQVPIPPGPVLGSCKYIVTLSKPEKILPLRQNNYKMVPLLGRELRNHSPSKRTLLWAGTLALVPGPKAWQSEARAASQPPYVPSWPGAFVQASVCIALPSPPCCPEPNSRTPCSNRACAHLRSDK